MNKNNYQALRAIVPTLLLLAIKTIPLAILAYFAFGLLLPSKPSESKAAEILGVLNTNWKALVFLGVLLFSRRIDTFLSNLYSVTLMGVRAQRTEPLPQPRPNKPEGQP